MTQLSNLLMGAIEDAHERAMRSLIEGWDREIEEHAAALRRLQAQKLQDAAKDAADAAALEVYLRGLVSQAAASPNDSTEVPAGITVASTLVGGPSMDALATLIAAVGEADAMCDPAQRSASWALRNHFVPHPTDLAQLLDSVGVDQGFAQRFADNGRQLAVLDDKSFVRNPQLQIAHGAARLDIVHDTVKLLDAYGSDRTLRLVANPRSLVELPGKVGAPEAVQRGGRPRMGEAAFNRMLDRLAF